MLCHGFSEVLFVSFLHGVMEIRRAEQTDCHPIGDCNRLFGRVVAGVPKHFHKKLVVGLHAVGYRVADPVIEIVVIAGGVTKEFGHWHPSALWTTSITDKVYLFIG